VIRVLIADDHPVVRDGLSGIFGGAEDFEVVGLASDGEEAVELARRLKPDVVLMDLRMPNMDGLQATRQLRRNGNAVPIIALTADPATLRRAEALDAGCDACLSKPFKVADLIASIRLSTRAAG